MKYFLGAAALLAATVSADLCSEGSTDDDGNYYCQEVTAITYTGVGGTDSYDMITDMDSTTGDCTSETYSYSGALAPLDEEVSVHFRGPLNLLQFAVYMPASTSSKKARRSAPAAERRHAHGHGHQHLHKAREAADKRSVGSEVTATIDGQVVSWVNEYSGESATAAVSSVVAAVTSAVAAATSAVGDVVSSAEAAASSAVSSIEGSTVDGAWGVEAYYNAENGTAEGLVFLNHYGGTGSGVWDDVFGNSLSYASDDGSTGSAEAVTLSNCTLASSTEVVIMTDTSCDDDECNYVRNGTVAYHGFDGASKLFLFEFSMPSDGETSASEYDAVNMPAIWLLNANIPRTLQYGSEDCSCWESGCGEFDMFEVLAAGDTRAKSTLHGNIAGGDSDYFARPESASIKVALLMYDDEIHIQIMDDDVDFVTSLTADFVADIVSATSTQTSDVSVFALS